MTIDLSKEQERNSQMTRDVENIALNPKPVVRCDTVDLSKVQPGDTVRFRCGGEAVVGSVIVGITRSILTFNSSIWVNEYKNDGTRTPYNDPFDIIEIIPKPFDWKDVKWGDAFERDGGIFLFIGYSTNGADGDAGFFAKHNDGLCPRSYHYELRYMNRAPEHDIKVAKMLNGEGE